MIKRRRTNAMREGSLPCLRTAPINIGFAKTKRKKAIVFV